MRKRIFIALLTLAMAGVFALADTPREPAASTEAGATYVCPLSGEELPCPACCPGE